MKTLNVTDEQATIIAKQEKDDEMLFPVMMEQPPDDWFLLNQPNKYDNLGVWAASECVLFTKNGNIPNFSIPYSDKDCNAMMVIPIPYPKGTILGIRETWHYDGEEYFYKANYTEEQLGYTLFRWHFSTTMPHDAIRSQYEVIGNEVKRVQDINLTEMQLIMGMDLHFRATKILYCSGVADKFKQWFNSHHKRKKITWDDNVYIGLIKAKKL